MKPLPEYLEFSWCQMMIHGTIWVLIKVQKINTINHLINTTRCKPNLYSIKHVYGIV